MKHSTLFRMACRLLAANGAPATPRPVLANPIVPVTLGFQREGLDLFSERGPSMSSCVTDLDVFIMSPKEFNHE